MLNQDEYADALKLAQSYANVHPEPDSVYGRRLAQLLELIREYEHQRELTHACEVLTRARGEA
jgi:hypothetical protein